MFSKLTEQGKIELDTQDSSKFYSFGVWHWLDSQPNSLEILELPLFTWTELFKENLERLMEASDAELPIVQVSTELVITTKKNT